MNIENAANRGEIIIYRAEDNTVQLDVRMEQETVWLTQKQIAELFGVKKAAISKHIANIFGQGELSPEATVSKMETVPFRMATNVLQQRCSCGSSIIMASCIVRMARNVSRIIP